MEVSGAAGDVTAEADIDEPGTVILSLDEHRGVGQSQVAWASMTPLEAFLLADELKQAARDAEKKMPEDPLT